ncbi:putative ribonuclease H protein [Glycine max]|nr:putative ribonuclease H protein [Glycine max]
MLQFANDTLMLGDVTLENVYAVYEKLKVNFHKSKLGEICVEEAVIEMFDSFLNCRMMKISFVFLGIPIGANPRKERTRQSIIQKINIPTRVIREINKLQTDFLWGGSDDERKICWVSWVKIFQEKEEGGLGVKSLKEFNQALLAKWRWRMTCC